MSEISRLFKIEVKDTAAPLDLFRAWLEDAIVAYGEFAAKSMTLATVSDDGIVSCRNVLMRAHDENGFMFATSRRSRKYADIQSHPQVSLCVFWIAKINGETHSRQVRIEGLAKEMPDDFARTLFRSSSLRTKIRLTFCKQNNEIAWEELKKRHEDFIKQHAATGGKDIPIDDNTVYYNIIPHRVEYYESLVDPITIGDRILFRNDDNGWSCVHIEA